MCGIAGFLSNALWQENASLNWLDATLRQLQKADVGALQHLETALAELSSHFPDLMRFATHLAIIEDTGVRRQLEQMQTALQQLEDKLPGAAAAGNDQAGRYLEGVRDYSWQLRAEVLDNVARTLNLLPDALAPDAVGRARHFVAWGIEQVLENIDRLEVRGRDSSGIVVQLILDPAWSMQQSPATLRAELDRRSGDLHAEHGGVLAHRLSDGRTVCRFVYKVANLIGKLGDNGAHLRAAIRADALLWDIARFTRTLSILAHTRWASNGIINLANCHPVNASLSADFPGDRSADADVVGVLNGDVDNYQQLVTSAVESRHCALPPAIRTDAKIIPVLFRLDTAADQPLAERVLTVIRRLEGSMAIGILHPDDPDHLYLAQKGSGQSLFIAQVSDGWLLASEVYGLAARARRCLPLVQVGRGGVQVTLDSSLEATPHARLIDDGEPIELAPETIEIFSRDIYRGGFDYFLEKEIHEAPTSLRKTLQGRYSKNGRKVSFETGEQNDLEPLIARLRDQSLPPVRRIIVTGQGTASIAAMGTAFLIQKALDGAPIVVDWGKASELSTGFADAP